MVMTGGIVYYCFNHIAANYSTCLRLTGFVIVTDRGVYGAWCASTLALKPCHGQCNWDPLVIQEFAMESNLIYIYI